MSIFKKILIALLSVCMTVCAGIAIAACDNTDNPNHDNGPGNQGGIINPDDDKEDENKTAYTITMTSQGGMPLQGVTVFLSKDGKDVSEKIISGANGKAVLVVDELGEYDVNIESVPAGFQLAENSRSKTSPNIQAFTLRFTSSVIKLATPAGTSYKLGSVMYDFSFTESSTGEKYSLADTLDENIGGKKAVLLSFWGTKCPPCRAELPAMQEAYEKYSDKLEIFALSSYMQSDTDSILANFKAENNYTFPMGVDYGVGTANEYGYFGVAAYPTSVIVDRYGVVAYRASGGDTSTASWEALFERFTKDDYSQGGVIVPGSDDEEQELVKRPDNITSPDYGEVSKAVSGTDGKKYEYYTDETYEEDWFWNTANVDGRSVISPNNHSTDYSFSSIYVKIDLKPGEGIQYDYNVNTLSDRNILNVFVNGKRVVRHYNDSNGWQTCREVDGAPLFIANRSCTVELGFLYLKASRVEKDTPVYIDNISVYDARNTSVTTDLAVSPVEGLTPDAQGKYNVNVERGDDGIYYYSYQNADGETEKVLLVVDILNLTYWAERHLTNTYFTVSQSGYADSRKDASVYNIGYWYWDGDMRLDGKNYRTSLYNTYYLQQFSETGYMPVTDDVKDMLYAFTKLAYRGNFSAPEGAEYSLSAIKCVDEWYEDQWLELCYFFMHFGPEHDNPEECSRYFNPAKGLVFDLAYEAELDTDIEVNITKILNLSYDSLNAGGGIKYKFTPKESGIYIITSSHKNDVDPNVAIFDLSTRRMIAENNDNDSFFNLDSVDFCVYVQLKANVTYGINACMNFVQDTGSYTMRITKSDKDRIEILRPATTYNGLTWYSDNDGNPTDADGNPSDTYIYYYMAVKTVLNNDNNIYYQFLNGGNFGSVMYINFVYANYFEANGHSLYQIFTSKNSILDDETKAVLEKYYEKSIAGKDEKDELYGFTEATAELVNALTSVILQYSGEIYDRDWERFACYYVYYNANTDN